MPVKQSESTIYASLLVETVFIVCSLVAVIANPLPHATNNSYSVQYDDRYIDTDMTEDMIKKVYFVVGVEDIEVPTTEVVEAEIVQATST